LPIQLQYFDSADQAFISLFYRLDQDGEEDQVIPASQFYRIKDLTPIQGQANSIYAYTEPRQPTGVHQDGSLTYAVDSITLVWNAPVDEGCSEITNYVIEADINGWQEVGQSTQHWCRTFTNSKWPVD
jgi:hypothetical protein